MSSVTLSICLEIVAADRLTTQTTVFGKDREFQQQIPGTHLQLTI